MNLCFRFLLHFTAALLHFTMRIPWAEDEASLSASLDICIFSLVCRYHGEVSVLRRGIGLLGWHGRQGASAPLFESVRYMISRAGLHSTRSLVGLLSPYMNDWGGWAWI